ncbi:Protein ZBED8 [Eumeta japonica]|uniref:Protein ZBED8 n=1 Tax=Eumeta variegata TaxID=151549 RepID=A0A4C1X8X2_EUMVA|nr:Protein ZBED8 [Eumeta japonica]
MGEEIQEELLFAKTLKTDTKSESIFNVLSDFFKEKSIPFTNVISVATDGVPAMVGRYRGFISHLKRIVPELYSVSVVRYLRDDTQISHYVRKQRWYPSEHHGPLAAARGGSAPHNVSVQCVEERCLYSAYFFAAEARGIVCGRAGPPA